MITRRTRTERGASLDGIMATLQSLLRQDALVVSSSLAHTPFDVCVRQQAGWRHLRFLPDVFARSDVEFGREEQRTDATRDTGIVLGEEDLDIRRHGDALAALAAPQRPRTHKLRRLDSLFAEKISGQALPDVLFVGETGVRLRSVLAGAEGLLARHRPCVVLPDADARRTLPVAGLLTRHGYCLAGPEDSANRRWALALPEERMASADLDHPYRGTSAREDKTMSISDELPRWGFHALEERAGSSWCWMGPRPAAGVLIPEQDGMPLALSLHMGASAAKGLAEQALLSWDGIPLQAVWRGTPGGKGVLECQLPEGLAWQPFNELTVSFPATFADPQSARRLTMAVTDVSLLITRS